MYAIKTNQRAFVYISISFLIINWWIPKTMNYRLDHRLFFFFRLKTQEKISLCFIFSEKFRSARQVFVIWDWLKMTDSQGNHCLIFPSSFFFSINFFFHSVNVNFYLEINVTKNESFSFIYLFPIQFDIEIVILTKKSSILQSEQFSVQLLNLFWILSFIVFWLIRCSWCFWFQIIFFNYCWKFCLNLKIFTYGCSIII